VINTDSHHIGHLDAMRYGIRQLRRAWLTRADVLNTQPVDVFLAELRARP
jgi:DNA polymerase (family 10)